jgi:hypothetical protein
MKALSVLFHISVPQLLADISWNTVLLIGEVASGAYLRSAH